MRKPKFVDIVLLLESIYIFMCAWLSALGKLDGLPDSLKYTMIVLSICGIAYVWYKYIAKEYTNKGIIFMITVLPLMWNTLLIVRM